jgi:hypothetical protein
VIPVNGKRAIPKSSDASVCRKRCGCAPATPDRLRHAALTRVRRPVVSLKKNRRLSFAGALGSGRSSSASQCGPWQLNLNRPVVLDGALHEIASPDVRSLKRYHVGNAEAGITHQQSYTEPRHWLPASVEVSKTWLDSLPSIRDSGRTRRIAGVAQRP